MNNLKGCIKILGLICLLFICSIYSQGDIRENLYSKSCLSNKPLLTIDYGMYQMRGNSSIDFSYYYNDCALMTDRYFVRNFIYDDNLSAIDINFDNFKYLDELENISMLFDKNLTIKYT